MKRILPTFIAIIILTSNVSAAPEWYFDKAMNGVQFWKNKDQKNCRVVVDQQAEGSNKPIDYYRTNVFTEELQKNKKFTLGMFGIEDWTVKINNVSEKDDKIIVDFSGQYRDQNNENTFYSERHIYGAKDLIQFLYTCPSPIPEKFGSLKVFDFILSAMRAGVKK